MNRLMTKLKIHDIGWRVSLENPYLEREWAGSPRVGDYYS